MSPDVSGGIGGRGRGNEQTPAGPGLASPIATNCHQLTACGKMEAAGIAPASHLTQALFQTNLRKLPHGPVEGARDDAALRELLMSWHLLKPDIRAVTQLVQGRG
jgi:hypothetical protein